jgi:hypothetical protein
MEGPAAFAAIGPCVSAVSFPLSLLKGTGGESWLPSRPWRLAFLLLSSRSVLRFAGRSAVFPFSLIDDGANRLLERA